MQRSLVRRGNFQTFVYPSYRGAGTFTLKAGLAQMLKGGIIMDVTDAAQAKIAEEAGVVYCIILYRVFY